MNQMLKNADLLKLAGVLILIGGLAAVSGCVTHHPNLFSKPTYIPTPAPVTSSDKDNWIKIDPIPDFTTDASFNIVGSSLLWINGTTNLPADSALNLDISYNSVPQYPIHKTKIITQAYKNGSNSFSYAYDLKGKPPGSYHIWIFDTMVLNSASVDFNITSPVPYLSWITMDPIEPVKPGEVLPISGTTDLPAGRWVSIKGWMEYHPCPFPRVPDPEGLRTLCGSTSNCAGTEDTIDGTAQVVEGTQGVNRWNTSIQIGDLCNGEEYGIWVHAIDWPNATTGGRRIELVK